jgi:TrmH family RNA methyltransferase
MIKKISKNKVREFAMLQKKKFRDIENIFIVEGDKIVNELLNVKYENTIVIATENWISNNYKLMNNIELYEAEINDLKKISSLKTPNQVIAIATKKQYFIEKQILKEKLSLVLDDIQDPGNLGTIIRLADWFGIENIICSPNTVELYNPKVIQATMGAFLRVNINYTNLELLFDEIKQIKNFSIYGTFIRGESIYKAKLKNSGFVVLGNESNGISAKIEKYVTDKISIPNYSKNEIKTESLNAAVAGAIICSEFRRLYP